MSVCMCLCVYVFEYVYVCVCVCMCLCMCGWMTDVLHSVTVFFTLKNYMLMGLLQFLELYNQ